MSSKYAELSVMWRHGSSPKIWEAAVYLIKDYYSEALNERACVHFKLNSACCAIRLKWSGVTGISLMVTPFSSYSLFVFFIFWGFWSADTWAEHELMRFIRAKLHDAHSPESRTVEVKPGEEDVTNPACVCLNDAWCERWPVMIYSPSGRAALTSKEFDHFRHSRCLMWPYFWETVFYLCLWKWVLAHDSLTEISSLKAEKLWYWLKCVSERMHVAGKCSLQPSWPEKWR